MATSVGLGIGPVPTPRLTTGVPQVDSLLGPLVGGENIAWSVDDDPATLIATILAAAGPTAIAVDAQQLQSLQSQPPDVSTFLIDLSSATTSQTRTIVSVAQSIFSAQRSVCHWLAAPDTPARNEWAWAMQVELDVADGAVSVVRADGRAVSRNRVALGDSHDLNGSRRPGPGASALGRGVRAARTDRGWSQSELARRVGITPSAISQMERGRLGISLDTAIDIAEQLGLPLDTLARGDAATPIIVEQRDGIPAENAPATAVASPLARGALRSHRLSPHETLSPSTGPAGTLTILIGSGLVCVERASSRMLARAADVVSLTNAHGASIRNVGDAHAILFHF